jgi:hypothetical protein
MASSLKLSELPSSSDLNASDLFLVADVENQQSKSVRFDSLNSSLVFQNMSGYDSYTAEVEEINDNISTIIGTFAGDTFKSLAELYDQINSNATLETTRFDSVSNIVDILDGRVSTELLTNGQNIASLFNRLDELEDMQFQAGLATGYLYAQNVTVGEV